MGHCELGIGKAVTKSNKSQLPICYALYYIRKYNRSTWFCTYLSSFKYVVEARTIFHSPILLKTMVRNGSRKPMAKTNSLGIGDTPSVLIMLQWPTWQSYP